MSTCYALAQAARFDMPEDVRQPALAHLYDMLPEADRVVKGLAKAITMTNDEKLFDIVATLDWHMPSNPDLFAIVHTHPTFVPVASAGKAWLTITQTSLDDFLHLLRNNSKAQSNSMVASVAKAYMAAPLHPVDTKTAKQVSTFRLNAEWEGQGVHGTTIDKLLSAAIDDDMWIASYGRQNHYFGLASLMRLAPHTVPTALNTHGLAVRDFTAHQTMDLLACLPNPTIWRHMSTREAGQSLRTHLAQTFDWALSRKERKALTRKKTRAGSHLANTPEAIAKRKQRAAKKQRALQQEGEE